MPAAMTPEQPLPSHAASKSTEKRPSACMLMMTQFWLARGVTPAVTPTGTGAVRNCRPLLRFRYVQPARSPAADGIAGNTAPDVGCDEVSGRPKAAGGGEKMIPPELMEAFSCSSKRTSSATGIAELFNGAVAAVVWEGSVTAD